MTKRQRIAIVRVPGVATETIDELAYYLKKKYQSSDYEIIVTNEDL